jgi:hypothetical protein
MVHRKHLISWPKRRRSDEEERWRTKKELLPIFLKSRNAGIILSRGNAILILGKRCFWNVQRGKQQACYPAHAFCPYHLF